MINTFKWTISVRLLGTVLAAPIVFVSTSSSAADNNLTQLNLGSQLLSDVRTALPERSAVNESFLSSEYNPNLRLSEDSHLAVSFVDEGAGYRNSIGYFEFSDTAFSGLSFNDIDSNGSGRVSLSEMNALDGVQADVLFSNFSASGSGGSLNYGDTLVIGGGSISETTDGLSMDGGKLFEAGTNVGFFVSANAYTSSGVKGYDIGGDPNTYYSLDFLNPEAGSNATLGNANENARHTAMLFADTSKDSVLVGFEDLKRPYGDNDFNDAIFLVQSDPATAISDNTLEIATAPLPDIGAGKLSGLISLFLGFSLIRRRGNQNTEV
jgi:hypothetical protein